MRRHLLTALAITLTSTTCLQAQSCRNDRNAVISRYSLQAIPSRTIPNRVTYVTPRTIQPQTVVQYKFGAQTYLDELTADLYGQANAICWEMHHYYNLNVDFDATYAAMYKILQDTKHVASLVNRDQTTGEHRNHIAADLHEMDALYCQIEEGVSRWRPVRTYYDRQVALSVKMEQFGETLHHLMEDYGVRSRVGEAPPPVQPFGEAPAPTIPAPVIPVPDRTSPGTFDRIPTYDLPAPRETAFPTRTDNTDRGISGIGLPNQLTPGVVPNRIPNLPLPTPPARPSLADPLPVPVPDIANDYPEMRIPGF